MLQGSHSDIPSLLSFGHTHLWHFLYPIVQRLIVACSIVLTSCAPCPIFPLEAREGTDARFDFQLWQTMPNTQSGRKVELGGRILETQPGVTRTTIVVAELPIIERPAYGPTDARKSKGRFVLTFPGQVETKWTLVGNRIVAIGTTMAGQRVSVDEVVRVLPSLQATCIHFWATMGSEISQFTHTGSHEAAAQETICWPEKDPKGSSYIPVCETEG